MIAAIAHELEIVQTIVFGDGPLIGIVLTVQFGDCLWIGIVQTVDFEDHIIILGIVWSIGFECFILLTI